MTVFWENFHFLRPYWLLALIPVAIIWFALRRNQDPVHLFNGLIAPHLLRHLLHQPEKRNVSQPAHLLLLVWILLTMAVAGPSWRMVPSPFAEDKAGLMILIKLNPTILSEDVRPSRLERVRFKLHDLFKLRAGGVAGLIAYSGSSHLVMPLTQDTRIIEHMAEALLPTLMPAEGDSLTEALALAADQFTGRNTAGSVLVITDSIAQSQVGDLTEYGKSNPFPLQILAALPSKALVIQNGVEAGARALGAPVTLLTVDETDIRQILKHAASQVVASTPQTEGEQWKDGGYLLVPFIVLGALLWSRRGWRVRWE
ncbi:MAG: VWA domain-containing protein [Desulfatitalea sp.]|nr:VWA domain-containing protein [Desulfatitalea sp.]NNK02066.1 VWA domain-containing protein [Desulfatitalea sp.]